MSYLDELKDGIKAKPKYQLAFFSVIATIIGVATFGDFGNGKMAISAILGSPAGVALAVMPFIIFSLGVIYSLGKVIKENNKKNNKKNYDKEIAMKEYLRKQISEDKEKIEELKNKLDQLIDENIDKLKTQPEIDKANDELTQFKQEYETDVKDSSKRKKYQEQCDKVLDMATKETLKDQVQKIFEGRSRTILNEKDQKHKDITKDEFSDTKLRNFFKKLGLEYEVDNLQNLVKENLKQEDLLQKDLARTSHYVVGDYYSDNMQKTPIQDYNFDIPSTTYIKNIKHKALLAKEASKEKKGR